MFKILLQLRESFLKAISSFPKMILNFFKNLLKFHSVASQKSRNQFRLLLQLQNFREVEAVSNLLRSCKADSGGRVQLTLFD